ncbi:MAG: type II secretion system major pseudopilin GspG [Planctomycetota bacterium]|nr:type II secretion system major pseudopilin GspG [Planctomycetota bacterium]
MRCERESGSRLKRAFTLVELLVVIAIIGLLATIVTVNVLKSMKKARQVKARADIKGISTACDMFKIDNARFPESLDELANPAGDLRNWDGPYLKEGTGIPMDPWNRPYLYFLDSSGYIIKSLGADGQEGGEDENMDVSNIATPAGR